MDKKKFDNLPLLGAILTAVLASLCCIGPLILALFSIGGAGMFSKFENTRPIFIAVTFVLLATDFYLTYRKRKSKCEDGTCKVGVAGRWNKIVLWFATFIIFLAILFPYFNFTTSTRAKIEQSGVIKEVVISVQGMTCGGCEFNIEKAVEKLDGIYEAKADQRKGIVYIKFNSGRVNVEEIKEAINKTGYKAL